MNRFYVSVNGNDEGSGLAEAPFLSVKRAVEAARCAEGASEIIISGGRWGEGFL